MMPNPPFFGWQYDETIHFEIQKVAGRNPTHNLPPILRLASPVEPSKAWPPWTHQETL